MTICIKNTMPKGFLNFVADKAKLGLRVLAIGYKNIEVSQTNNLTYWNRQNAEKQLVFCGFVIFKNYLKESTSRTISMLENANLRT